MKTSIVTTIAALLVITNIVAAEDIEKICPGGHVAGEFIVKMKTPNLRTSSLEAQREQVAEHTVKLQSHLLTEKRPQNSKSKKLIQGLYIVEHSKKSINRSSIAGQSTSTTLTKKEQQQQDQNTLQELRNDPDVEYAYPNCLVKQNDAPTGDLTLAGSVLYPIKEKFNLPHMVFPVDETDTYGVINSQLDLIWNKLSIEDSEYNHSLNPYIFLPFVSSPGDAPSIMGISETYSRTETCALSEIKGRYSGHLDDLSIPLTKHFEGLGGYSRCLGYTGDINNDGVKEIIIVGRDTSSTTPSKALIFDPSTTTFYATQFNHDVISIQVSDLNNDGMNELIALTYQDRFINPLYYLEVLPYLGNNTFGISQKTKFAEAPNNDYPEAGLAISDFDRDGDQDILATGGQAIWLMKNDGDGSFSDTEVNELDAMDGTFFFERHKAAFVDLDNDGWLDIIAQSTSELVLMKNDQGDFPYYTRYILDETLGYSLTDLQGDGYTDIVISDNNRNSVYPILTSGPNGLIEGHPAIDPNTYQEVTEYQRTLEYAPRNGPLLYHPAASYELQVRATHTSIPSLTYTTRTDAEGKYSFKGLRAGTYRVDIVNPDSTYVDTTTRTVTLNDNKTDVNFKIRKDFLPKDIPAGVAQSNDPGFNLLWGLHNSGQSGGTVDIDMDVIEAWQRTQGDENIVVAVIDDGVDINHPDLKNNIALNTREIPGNGIDDDQNGYIDDYYGLDTANGDTDPSPFIFSNNHGTHVAGTIAASGNNNQGVIGVAPKAKILPIKASLDGGRGLPTSAILEGMQYTYTRKLSGENIRVLNGSFGGYQQSCPEFYIEALNALSSAGISLVFAAGNDQIDHESEFQSYPAACPIQGLLSVAAVNKYGELASFSDYGASKVHVGAPGVDIWSTGPLPWDGHIESGYYSNNGTSMAAPHVAGALALLYSANPTFTPQQAKDRIMQTVKPLSSLQGKTASGGIVSIARALGLKPSQTPPTPGIIPPGGDSKGEDSTPSFELKARRIVARYNKRKKRVIIRAIDIQATDGRALKGGYMTAVKRKKKSKTSSFKQKANGKFVAVVKFSQNPKGRRRGKVTDFDLSIRALCTCDQEGGLDTVVSVRVR